jgi:putative chitinase
MKKIKEFQQEYGLVSDGIIGPITLRAMQSKIGVSDVQIANFMGQLHHETGGFKHDTESLNYSATGLISTFSYYRSHKMEAWKDGRTLLHKADQETIANKVYWDVNRSSGYLLGNKLWGDGWKYRGRGAIMITGKYNYRGFNNWIGYGVLENPEIASTELYWESAMWYFEKNKLWGLSEKMTFKSMSDLTRGIQGGLRGLDERIRMTRYYAKMLGV